MVAEDTSHQRRGRKFDKGGSSWLVSADKIRTARLEELHQLYDGLTRAYQRGIERLDGPQLGEVTPETTESDPFIRMVLYRGTQEIKQNMKEIEREIELRVGMLRSDANPVKYIVQPGSMPCILDTDDSSE